MSAAWDLPRVQIGHEKRGVLLNMQPARRGSKSRTMTSGRPAGAVTNRTGHLEVALWRRASSSFRSHGLLLTCRFCGHDASLADNTPPAFCMKTIRATWAVALRARAFEPNSTCVPAPWRPSVILPRRGWGRTRARPRRPGGPFPPPDRRIRALPCLRAGRRCADRPRPAAP
jgi:hypothetical protein